MAEVVIANFAPIFSYFELFLTNVAPSTKYERFSYLLYPLETAFPPPKRCKSHLYRPTILMLSLVDVTHVLGMCGN